MTGFMSPIQTNPLSAMTAETVSAPHSTVQSEGKEDAEIMQAAKDFEAAFITQMLKYSGLGEAMTKNGGEDVQAFTDFYIENFAEKIVEKGGFGLADKFYEKLLAKETAHAELESVLNVKS